MASSRHTNCFWFKVWIILILSSIFVYGKAKKGRADVINSEIHKNIVDIFHRLLSNARNSPNGGVRINIKNPTEVIQKNYACLSINQERVDRYSILRPKLIAAYPCNNNNNYLWNLEGDILKDKDNRYIACLGPKDCHGSNSNHFTMKDEVWHIRVYRHQVQEKENQVYFSIRSGKFPDKCLTVNYQVRVNYIPHITLDKCEGRDDQSFFIDDLIWKLTKKKNWAYRPYPPKSSPNSAYRPYPPKSSSATNFYLLPLPKHLFPADIQF